jgi:hypothetical protein
MRLRAPRRASSSIPAVLALAALLLAGGCGIGPLDAKASPVTGSGDVKTENRTSGTFTAVSATGGLNVVVSTGPAMVVTVTAQANVLPYVRTDVAGGRLTATILDPGIASSRPVTVAVTVPTLTALTLDGGATGTMQLETDLLTISLSGGATLQAIGTVSHLALSVDGDAQAQLGDLAADSVTVTLAGGAQATVRATTLVTGTADGGATLTLAAAPASMTVKATNGATIAGG